MPESRCYTMPEVLAKLQMAKTTFKTLRRTGRLPFLEELRPRLGRRVRYRADLIDKYLSGEWQQRPALTFGRKRRA
jgi:predicted DNA-binding transcriptional regulator AlpA